MMWMETNWITAVSYTHLLCKPDQVVWIDGSEAQLNELRAQATETKEMIPLNQEKLPGCYLHRTCLLYTSRM